MDAIYTAAKCRALAIELGFTTGDKLSSAMQEWEAEADANPELRPRSACSRSWCQKLLKLDGIEGVNFYEAQLSEATKFFWDIQNRPKGQKE